MYKRLIKATIKIDKNQLTTPEKIAVNDSHNFAATIKRNPYLHLRASTEDFAVEIAKAQADELRMKRSQAEEKSKPLKPSLSITIM